IHRIGRTGRADKKGIAISFVIEKEQPYLQKIEELMAYTIPVLELPENLKISTVLRPDEEPKQYMKTIQLKIPSKEESGPAFHPKSAKNSKTNYVVSRKDRMMKKYGKPKTRGQKKKK
ncbi:MAG: ATP-dependent helicase, partial [Ferruginibacter sp.]